MKAFATLATIGLAAASPVLVDSIHHEAAPLLSSTTATEIPDSYIVVFKDHVSHVAAQQHHSWLSSVHLAREEDRRVSKRGLQLPFWEQAFEGLRHTYNIPGSFLGYSGHFDESTVESIRRHPDVAFVERDGVVHTMEESPDLEKNAPWGLARISHRKSLNFGSFNKYLYSHDGGEGVDVYVIDTGTNINHVDFEGRASWGKTIPKDDADEDGNGHGTHCSGTVAGKKYGVAKKANIVAIKVLKSNGSGSISDVVKGVEEATIRHQKKVSAAKKSGKKFKGSAANMSLGGGKSQALDRTVNAAVDAGIHFAVAAGNDNRDSCSYSPAAAEKAVTVGASTLLDERAYFSNFGPCNDIFAPGLNIVSTWIGSKYATNTISGTSMASPHIAGLLAYMLSLQPDADSAYATSAITPKELKANLIDIATPGALSDVPKDTTNILAWNGGGSGNYSDIVDEGRAFNAAYQRQIGKGAQLAGEVVDAVYELESVFEEEMRELKAQFDRMVEL